MGWLRWRRGVRLNGTIRDTEDDRFLDILRYLSDDRLELRLGAIYALGRLSRGRESEHWAAVDVLAAYVRERSVAARGGSPAPSRLQSDIRAALGVLASGVWRSGADDDRRVDLSGADLRTVDLRGSHFEAALFVRTRFDHANLRAAHLDGAVLSGACLDGIQLDGAALSGGRLSDASLVGASLRGSVLHGADVGGADFREADLRGSDLRGTIGLTREQIALALTDRTTLVDPDPDQKKPRAVEPPAANGTSSTAGWKNPLPHVVSGYYHSDPALHQCPKCSSSDVDRSRWRRAGDTLVLKLFNRRAYECLSCGQEFYDRPSSNRA